ncbi:hypothetical protein P167DRAFT_548631 [Morchella conica CCBAS932]|uniref:Uncharacterized protein n=1 Tax=Morchella conica CCBAS932 TaxID=1392247 RepID=A0A3N4KSW8_9PEZI|nr:hypothetical protein P167DRAFT_548631 [Morchella conica CCBAS932]
MPTNLLLPRAPPPPPPPPPLETMQIQGRVSPPSPLLHVSLPHLFTEGLVWCTRLLEENRDKCLMISPLFGHFPRFVTKAQDHSHNKWYPPWINNRTHRPNEMTNMLYIFPGLLNRQRTGRNKNQHWVRKYAEEHDPQTGSNYIPSFQALSHESFQQSTPQIYRESRSSSGINRAFRLKLHFYSLRRGQFQAFPDGELIGKANTSHHKLTDPFGLAGHHPYSWFKTLHSPFATSGHCTTLEDTASSTPFTLFEISF